jgi:hypothetical protein
VVGPVVAFVAAAMLTPSMSAQKPVPIEKRGAALEGGAHSNAEKLLEFSYAKLNLFHRASQGLEGKATRGRDILQLPVSSVRNDLWFEIRDVRSGPIDEIRGQRWSSLVAQRSGRLIQVIPHFKMLPGSAKFAVFDALWYDAPENRSIVADWDENVDYVLQVERGLADITGYIAYRVTAHLQGESRTYPALALLHGNTATAGHLPIEFFDSVLGPSTLENALSETSHSAPPDWQQRSDPANFRSGTGAKSSPRNASYPRQAHLAGITFRAPFNVSGSSMVQDFLQSCEGGFCCQDGICCEENCSAFDTCADLEPYCYVPVGGGGGGGDPACAVLHNTGQYQNVGGSDTTDHVCNGSACSGQHEWGTTLVWTCDRDANCVFSCNVARQNPPASPFYQDTGGIATLGNSHFATFAEADVGGPAMCSHSVAIAVNSCLFSCSVTLTVKKDGFEMSWVGTGIWTSSGQYVNDCKVNLGLQ